MSPMYIETPYTSVCVCVCGSVCVCVCVCVYLQKYPSTQS